MNLRSARLRVTLGFLLLPACGDEAPGDELPDEGAFTTGTTVTFGTSSSTTSDTDDTTTGSATTSTSSSAGPTTSGSTTQGTSTSTTELSETSGSADETTGSTSSVAPLESSSSEGVAATTDVVDDASTTTGIVGEDTSSSDDGTPLPGCGDGVPEAGEICLAVGDPVSLGDAVGPVDIVEGDFDDDGDLDVATANSDGTVTVLFGDGNGGFAAPEGPFAVGEDPVRIRSAQLDDLRGDDLVVLNRGNGVDNGSFTVLLADGAGGFDASTYEIGVAPADMDLAVLASPNAATVQPPDVVVANGESMTISTAVNNGDGTFLDPVTFVAEPNGGMGALGFPVFGIAVGAYGVPLANDILSIGSDRWIANAGAGNGLIGMASVAQNAPAASADALHRANSGDFDEDGGGDAVVLDGTSQIALMRVTPGAANFAMTFRAVAGPTEAIFGDPTGDGNIDVIVTSGTSNTVLVYLGDGTAIGAIASAFAVGSSPTGVAIGDLDGDGVDDIIVSSDAASGDDFVTVLLSDP